MGNGAKADVCVNKILPLMCEQVYMVSISENHTCFLKIDLSKYASKLTSVYFPTPVLVCLEMTASKCPAW